MNLFPSSDPVAVDLAHSALLLGVVASLKPSRCLELGYGAGQTTEAIRQSLQWNGQGVLAVVDNWHDWQGQEPPAIQRLREEGVEIVISDEESFLRAAPTSAWDLLVSDADHLRSDQWIEQHLRVVQPGGMLFFHDTANPDFPNLGRIVEQVKAKGLPHYHFAKSSRPDERCERGWLWVINQKPHIAIVTAWDDGAAEIGNLTWPNRRAYCKRHGYALRGGHVTHGHHWVKLPAMMAALEEGFDWVVWMDADAIITNPARMLEDHLDTTADLIFSHDVNGPNNGVMFWRNSNWTKQMLKKWAEVGPRYSDHPSPEQTTLVHLLYREPKEKWKIVGQKAFNAYRYQEYPQLHGPEGQWEPGDFILHLPGLSDSRRKEIFAQLV